MELKLKNNYYEKGITLISLVVTIIVLLILAGISINMALGNDGLIWQAKNVALVESSIEKNETKSNIEVRDYVKKENYNDDPDGFELTRNNQHLIGLSEETDYQDFYIPETVETDEGVKKITTLGEDFGRSISIQNLYIPDTVTRMNERALFWSYAQNVYIPKSTIYFDSMVLGTTWDLENVFVDSGNPLIKDIDGVVYSKSGKTIDLYPMGRTAESYSVNPGTETIGVNAFYDAKIKTIVLPSSIKRILGGAFDNSYIESITLPNSIEEIGAWAFYGCDKLTSISIPNSITKIVNGIVRDCIKLEQVNIGNNVTEIEDDAFFGCIKLSSVNLPSTLTKIGNQAFFDCGSLKNVTIPSNVTSIGEEAFSNTYATVSFENYTKIKYVGDYAFEGCTCNDQAAKNYILNLNANAFSSRGSAGWGSASVCSYKWGEQ